MKTRKPSSNVYIPPEVLTRILANLPAKSLLRFRCVCKSWCSIIDNPYFMNMHSKLFNKNKKFNSSELLALECLVQVGESGCLLTLLKADTLRKTRDIFKSSERYILHGSCNSLILISRDGPNDLCRGMRICNPSIRKSILLPHCPLFPWFDCNTTYVLGFAPQSKDFKVIAISFMRIGGVTLPKMRLAVCTLNDQQWIVRDNDDFNFDGLSPKDLFWPYYFCDGGAHWLGRAPCKDSSNQDYKPTDHLVSLDFDTESFTFLELPHVLDEDIITLRYLFVLGESLAFFCISSKRCRIWVLKHESGKREWTLWFSGPSSVDGFNLFYYTGSTRDRVLYFEGEGEGEGGGGYLVYGRKSYNIVTGQVQLLRKSMNPYVELVELEPADCERLVFYESLVLCKGYEVEDMTSSPISWGK